MTAVIVNSCIWEVIFNDLGGTQISWQLQEPSRLAEDVEATNDCQTLWKVTLEMLIVIVIDFRSSIQEKKNIDIYSDTSTVFENPVLRALTSQEFLEMAGATHTLLVKGQYPQAPPKFYFHSG